jgi:Ca-activated chloride channel family protein
MRAVCKKTDGERLLCNGHPEETMRRLSLLLAIPVHLAGQSVGIAVERPRPCVTCMDCAVRGPCVEPARVVRTSSVATLTIDGRVVRYEITEHFVNRGGMVGEAEYMLPLPARAAFEDLALSINGEMVTGETMRADRARAIYEEIVRRQRDPALVEWMGQGLLRTRIFPIAPGEDKTVVVRFRAVADREGDAVRIDYRPPVRRGDDATSSAVELRYAARGEFGRAFSPTHELDVRDNGSLRIARAERVHGVMTVLVPVRDAHAASVHVLTHAEAGDAGYAMITIAPPPASRTVTPRDVTFVVDVSGSMAGAKLEQARKAGRALLGTLTPTDRFRLIAFSTDVNTFRPGWQAASAPNIREAQQFLDGLTAGGSTNISGALEEALQVTEQSKRLSVVLFLTDGAPTVGERQPDRIAALAEHLRGRQRVFTFGVGSDVNASLLEQLALSGHGTAQFVRPDEDVERAVGLVAQRLTNPVVTDVRVRVDGVQVDRVQPAGSFDLFAGQEVTLFARYRNGRYRAEVRVTGSSVDGPVQWATTAEFPERAAENAFVARLWAVQRVGWLSAERRLHGATTEVDDELRALGTRYGIPTELTSYLVVEPGMQVNQPGDPRARRDASTSMSVVGGVAAASPPAARAFEAAKAASEQRAVRNMAQLDDAASIGKDRQQFVLGRMFTLRDGAWQDVAVDGPVPAALPRTVRVRAYSDAYFAILARLPALQEAFALGERVTLHGRNVVIVLDPAGDASLNASTLDMIVRDW